MRCGNGANQRLDIDVAVGPRRMLRVCVARRRIPAVLQRILGLCETPKPDDVADALALAICHAHTYKLAEYKPSRVGKR